MKNTTILSLLLLLSCSLFAGTAPKEIKVKSAIEEVTVFRVGAQITSYTLTVRYSGNDSKRVVMSSKERKKFTLDNGSYRITASVNASNVTNYAGSENLEGGSYTNEFYISSEPIRRY